jgi:two-component system, OmpR family, sensor histidine kinase MprB
MSFRLRLTVLAALAVAVTIVGTSLVVYFTDRSALIGQIDSDLKAHEIDALIATRPGRPKTKTPRVRAKFPSVAGLAIIRSGPQTVVILDTPRAGTTIRVSVHSRTAGSPPAQRPTFSTQTVAGVRSRVLTITFARRVVSLSESLAQTDRNLGHLRWLLVLISLGGLGAAALLGALVSRTAVAPLRRLTNTTDRVIETGDLSQRVAQPGRDEISRLSARLDELLATLQTSLRAQQQLVADASHELRTPIASVRANLELLAERLALTEDDRTTELLSDVRRELESMTTLVAELIELARGEETNIAPHEFRLDETVQAAVKRVERRASGVSFRTTLKPSVVVGVPERVERAVTNLLDNAAKWSPPEGTIDVSVLDGVVEVRDQGPGIAIEDRPHVFDRFYRSARARGMPGAGLGLAIVKQIADAHGGDVTIAESQGSGATLRLRLRSNS